jgi:hypothetical protein
MSGSADFSDPDSGYSVNNLAPHMPLSLTARRGSNGGTDLTWQAPSDTDIVRYAVYRGSDPSFVASEASQVAAVAATHYSDNAPGGIATYYRIAALDSAGNQGPCTEAVAVGGLTGMEAADALPRQFALSPGYPNPFNPSVVMRYALPHSSRVSIHVYDVLGRVVATLVQEDQQAGYHQVAWNAGNLASGLYLIRMTVANEPFTAVRKVLLVK